jgi:hypothetical protein
MTTRAILFSSSIGIIVGVASRAGTENKEDPTCSLHYHYARYFNPEYKSDDNLDDALNTYRY